MDLENKIFKDYLPVFENLNNYGFSKKLDIYEITKYFMNKEFHSKISISKQGYVIGKVYDSDDQEYLPLKVETLSGTFLKKIKDEYKNILYDIRANCFINKSQIKPRKEWLIPANPFLFNIDEGFRNNPELEWHQFGNVNEGDYVYIYMAAPISAIIYKCEITRANLPPNKGYKTIKPHKTMYLRLLKKYNSKLITIDFMKKYGASAVRGFRSMPEDLSDAIKGI